MDSLNDYLPLVVGLLSALIGIRGFTYDKNKSGIKAITKWGRLAILLTLVSFLFAVYTINRKNDELNDVKAIRKMVDNQLLIAVDNILSPFKGIDGAGLPNSNKSIDFSKLKDSTILSKLITSPILIRKDKNVLDSTAPYVIDSTYIDNGDRIMHDAILAFGGMMDVKEIVFVEKILSNDFFKTAYRFKGDQFQMFIRSANKRVNNKDLSENERDISGWATHKIYYTASNEKGRSGNYELIKLLDELEILYRYIKNEK